MNFWLVFRLKIKYFFLFCYNNTLHPTCNANGLVFIKIINFSGDIPLKHSRFDIIYQMIYTITEPGPHTLEWRYVKDAAVFGGEDCGWVDQLEWDGGGLPEAIRVHLQ